MAEPATTVSVSGVSLITLMTALLGPAIGPILGPYVVIITCSTVGAQWALLASPAMTKTQAWWLLLRVVGTAVVLTAMIAQLVAGYFDSTVTEAYGGVAFVIGAFGNKWTDILAALLQRAIAFITKSEPTKGDNA